LYTVDASVHVSALNPSETGSAHSQAFLAYARQHRLPLICPTLLVVEVAAAVARALDDAQRALVLVAALRDLSHQALIPLDEALTDRAALLSAHVRLRGADAVYAAVAQQYGTTLVTLDRQQLDRLAGTVGVLRPVDALREAQTRPQWRDDQ
jgi:predicted nucleic acid-binding protein